MFSFIFIRIMVILVGSADSPVARIVQEGSANINFHIGRNIILFGYHIHHFYFGVFLMGLAGWWAIVGSRDIGKDKLALLFGTGLGLFMDEIGLLLTWGDYTSSLSYLLGVFVLALFLNLIYFPRFWRKMRGSSGSSRSRSGKSLLGRAGSLLVDLADRVSGKSSEDGDQKG